MKIVAVVGSHDANDQVDRVAKEFGKWLAEQGVHLLTGGGPGVMKAVSKGFEGVSRTKRHGWSIGVLPSAPNGGLKPDYPNKYVEIVIKTHLHGQQNADGSGGDHPLGDYSRNHINALTADLMVAFPGGDGTRAEVKLALEQNKKVFALLEEGEFIGKHNPTPRAPEGTTVLSTLDKLKEALLPLLKG